MQNVSTRAAGVLFARALLGIIFFMQGFGKIFTIGVSTLYNMFFKDFENTVLPKWLIWSTAYFTSYVELVCGFLLIIGLFKRYALYLLAINLLIVSFGHGLLQPIWDLQHVIPRAGLLITLLLVPQEWDKWAIDAFVKKQSF
jgi:putative oxidoreductase